MKNLYNRDSQNDLNEEFTSQITLKEAEIFNLH